MKTFLSTKSSQKASLKLAKKSVKRIQVSLQELEDGAEPSLVMPLLREFMANLNKQIHEYNAYTNVLIGDKPV